MSCPSVTHEDRGLPPLQALLDDDPLPRRPEHAGERGPHGLLGLLAGAGDGDALARRGPVGLHDDRVVAVGAQVGERRRLAVEGLVAGRRDAGVAHELLGEDLRALYAGGGARGAEDLQARLPEGLGDAPDQGRLGTDDGQVYPVLPGEVAQGDEVVDGDVHGLRRCGRYRGCPGRRTSPRPAGLAARASTSACSRPPLPTTITRTALGPDPLYYRLVPLGADADHAQRRPDLGLDEPDEVPRRLGQIPPHPAPRDVHAPARERLVDGTGVVQVGLVHRVARRPSRRLSRSRRRP